MCNKVYEDSHIYLKPFSPMYVYKINQPAFVSWSIEFSLDVADEIFQLTPA